MKNTVNDSEAMRITADIVKAYLSTGGDKVVDLPALVREVRLALTGDEIDEAVAATNASSEKPSGATDVPTPAVPPEESITPEYLISLEDGRRYKSLKRHLWIKYGMTPEEYRAKWGLPADYPMVSPNYAAARSRIAVKIGLGARRDEDARTGDKAA